MSQAQKVQYKKETHIYYGEPSFETLSNYIKTAFKKKLPKDYVLTYIDEENDEITISCQGDLDAMKEQNQKTKIIIKEYIDSSSSESEPEEQKKSEGNPSSSQNQQQQCPFNFNQEQMNGCFKNMQNFFQQQAPIFKEMGKQFENNYKQQQFHPQNFNIFGLSDILSNLSNDKEMQKGMENIFSNFEKNLNQFVPKTQDQSQKQEEKSEESQTQTQKKESEDEQKEEENPLLQESSTQKSEGKEKEKEQEHDQDEEKEKEKKQEKYYSQAVKTLAEKVSDIMGQKPDFYFEICEKMQNVDLETIILTLVEQPEIMNKYPDFV